MSKEGFAKRLSESMFRAGLTQTALADRLGISKGALNQWTSGATTPHPANMVRAASILGVDPHWLRTGEEQPKKQAIGETPPADLWGKLLPEQRQELIALMESMVSRNQQTLAELLRMYGPAVPDDRVAQFLPPAPKLPK